MTANASLRADVGVASFDQAVWTEWVPHVDDCVADPGGLSTFYQGLPAGIVTANECNVQAHENACLLIWDRGCSRIGETRFGGQPVPVELLPGHGVFIPPGTDSKWASSSTTFSDIMHLHFTPALLDRALAHSDVRLTINNAPLIANFADAAVVTTIRWLFRETQRARPPSLMWDTASLFLTIQLLRALDQGAPVPELPRGGLASWQLKRVRDYLHVNFADDVRLDTLAALTGLSVYHFARAFKRSTGLAPHGHLIRLRVENARRLLETTDRSLIEIAFDVGYESSQSLARVFAKVLGLSPSAYRRQCERRGLQVESRRASS